MPKMKTRRGAAKRFKKTGSGKLKRGKAFRNHMLTKKASKIKRQARGFDDIAAADVPALRKLLPHKSR